MNWKDVLTNLPLWYLTDSGRHAHKTPARHLLPTGSYITHAEFNYLHALHHHDIETVCHQFHLSRSGLYRVLKSAYRRNGLDAWQDLLQYIPKDGTQDCPNY